MNDIDEHESRIVALREHYMRLGATWDTRPNVGRSKPVIAPDGRRFSSVRDAATAFGEREHSVRYWLKTRKSNWRFA